MGRGVIFRANVLIQLPPAKHKRPDLKVGPERSKAVDEPGTIRHRTYTGAGALGYGSRSLRPVGHLRRFRLVKYSRDVIKLNLDLS